MTMADLHNIGLKNESDISENLLPKLPSQSRPISLTLLPLFPQGSF